MSIDAILERLHIYFQVDSQSDLAEILGIKPNAISNWKKRNSIDYNLIITKCDNANLNWLLNGEVNMYKEFKANGHINVGEINITSIGNESKYGSEMNKLNFGLAKEAQEEMISNPIAQQLKTLQDKIEKQNIIIGSLESKIEGLNRELILKDEIISLMKNR